MSIRTLLIACILSCAHFLAIGQAYTISTIPYNPAPFTGISLLGTFSGVDDGVSEPISLPFDFCFYGTFYSQVWIGTNGWVSFLPNQPGTFTSAPIPSVAGSIPKAAIMAPWQDWWSTLNGNGNILYQTVGARPNRQFVVTFFQLPMFSCTGNLGTFQVILNECSNTIEIHILQKPPCLGWANGTAVLGLHNSNGTVAHTVTGRNSTQWVVNSSSPEGWLFVADESCAGENFGGIVSADTASLLPVINATCYNGNVDIKVKQGSLKCNTFSSDGSEFRLYDPRGNLMQILSVNPICTGDRTDSFRLEFANPFLFNGDHYLVIRNGIDGDPLLGDCGTGLFAFDTIIVRVSGCYEYNEPVRLRNVSTKFDNEGVVLTWNTPDNFDPDFFELYRVHYRPYHSDSLRWTNFANTFALEDTVIGTDIIDPLEERAFFRASLRLRIYGDIRTPGDSISNIVLKASDDRLTNGTRGTAQITWNPYDGWPNTGYEVYLQRPSDTTAGLLIGTTLDTTYEITKPEEIGWFKVRVRTVDSTSTFAAWSNYVPFEMQKREIEVPNVITPNGDGKNDQFKIKGIEFFPVNTVQLFNRWGQKVFEAQNYQNTYVPSDLESGVYLYKVIIPNEQGKEGAIRIIK